MSRVKVNAMDICDFCKLKADNTHLRFQLDVIKERAEETEALFKRFQDWEMVLLGITSLERLLAAMTGDLRERFHIDQARLMLTDADRRIRSLLESIEIKAPEDVLFESPPEGVQELRAPRLMTLGKAGLPPLFEPHGPVRSVALLPLVREERFFGLLGLGSRDPHRYVPELQTHVLTRLAAVCSVCLENAVNRERLELGGLTDPLTGLHNRRSLEQRLHAEVDHARRRREPLSCLFLDLDLFKEINDTFGHSAGDAVLRKVAEQLRAQLRGGDVAARFGGDELALLLPATGHQDACNMGERIRATINREPLPLEDGQEVRISLSIGVGTLAGSEMPEDVERAGQALLDAADAALYEAKRGGRNRVA